MEARRKYLFDAPAVGVDRLDDEAVSQQQDAGAHLVQEIEDVAGDEERAAVREVVAQEVAEEEDAVDVQAVEGLVGDHHRRRSEECADDADPNINEKLS